MVKTLRDVLSEQGIELTESSNGRWVAHCPFHEGDRDPSFTVYPNDTYYCFGCKVWGNPVKFLVDRGMTAAAAIEYVGADFTLPKSQKRVIKVKNILKTGVFLWGAAKLYHDHLMANPGPIKYLNDRGLTEKTITRHMIGYSDGSVLNFQFAEQYEMAEEVGLLNKGGFDVLSHRIVIPNIIDGEYYCDFMTGRTVINAKPKYLGLRMPKPIMGFHQYRHSPILFMVEGQFDWLLLRQWGYPAVVMSGSHITKHNVQLLRGKHIVYIPDNDDVGRKAAKMITETFGKANSTIIDISYYGYKDISEWAQFDTFADTRFEELVSEALCDIVLLNPNWMKFVPQLNLRIPSLST